MEIVLNKTRNAKNVKHATERFVLLPSRNLTTASASQEVKSLFKKLSTVKSNLDTSIETSLPGFFKPEIVVIDSIHENGAKLVEIPTESIASLRASYPSLRIIPEKFYYPQWVKYNIKHKLRSEIRRGGLKIRVVSDSDDAPVPNAHVIAFTNFDNREGVEAITNSKGEAL